MFAFKAFREDQRGNFATMFALSLVPFFGMVGAAIDYSRVTEVRARLADALDAGILAVGTEADMTEEKAHQIIEDWLSAHLDGQYAGLWRLDSVTLRDDGTVIAAASGSVETTIARILGFEKMGIAVTSEAIRSLGKVEVALVLDNTGSMRGTKLTKLKEAATALVESLADATADPEDLKMALVPFSQTVNVGKDYRNAEWMDRFARSSIHASIFTQDDGASPDRASVHTGTNRFTLFDNMGVEWGGCVESRPHPYDIEEAAPDIMVPDTLYVPYFAPDEPDREKDKRGGEIRPYGNDYMNDLSATNWWGKQGNPDKYSRRPNRTGDSRNEAGSLGYSLGPNSGCDLAAITRLTTGSEDVIEAIDDMVAVGNTHINIGLQWGWHVLSPNAPFADGVAYGDDEWTKVVVLMTDGNNENTDTSSDNKNRSVYSGYGYIWQERFGDWASTPNRKSRTEALDDRLEDLCANMKAEGIVIYTVRVEVRDGSSDVLKNCASEAANFKEVANIADLQQTFENIGGSIQKLRLSK